MVEQSFTYLIKLYWFWVKKEKRHDSLDFWTVRRVAIEHYSKVAAKENWCSFVPGSDLLS